MEWRLVELDSYSAAMNMAIDQAIYEHVALEDPLPTIRFYKWVKDAVSLGMYQDVNDINVHLCKERNIELVRRMTGGRAVFHGKQDFTYSVVVPIKAYNYSITTAYRSICNSILVALKKLGIKAEITNHNDVMVNGKKISGNAAKALEKGMYLQHGTIVYEADNQLMSQLFNTERKLFECKATSVKEECGASEDELYLALKQGFTKDKEIVGNGLTKEEKLRAEDLAFSRYKNVRLTRGKASNRGACYVNEGSML